MAATPQLAEPDAALARLVEPARHVASALGDVAREAWLVGGVVRDAFLGRPLVDLDVVVASPAERPARAIARAYAGTAFPLGDRFGCWRVALRDGAHLDICDLRGGSLQEDLRQRDFTMNAMAVPIAGEVALLDPHGGLRDLHERLVRVVREQSLDDDPLRMVRAARFAHALGMQLEPATLQAIRARAAHAAEPSGERTFAELSLLLLAPESRRAIRLLDQLGLVQPLLPELEACRGVEQSRYHHLDVYEHTLAVLDNVEDIAADPQHYLGHADGAPEQPFDDHAQLLLRCAAIAHDLGKPATRALRPDGRASFLGHDSVGIEVVDAVCDRWATSNRFRDGLRVLVGTHLGLGMLLHGPLDERAVYRYLRTVQPVAAEAVVLSLADRFATAGVDDRRRWVRAHATAARRVWQAHWNEQAHGLPVPLLDGVQIAEAAGIEPGPQLGALVRALAEEQAVGAVSTRDDAIRFVRELGGAGLDA